MIVTCQVDSLARYTTVRAILAMLTVLTEDGLQKAFLAKRVGPLIDQEAAHVLVLLLLPRVARRLRSLEHLPSLVSLRSQLLVLSCCLLERLRLLLLSGRRRKVTTAALVLLLVLLVLVVVVVVTSVGFGWRRLRSRP